MRRGWGSLAMRHGKRVVRFVGANGKETCRTLRRPLREQESEIEDIRREVEAARAGTRRVEPQRLRAWVVNVYGPVLRSRVSPSTLRAAEIHLGRLVAWVESHGDPTMDRLNRADAERFVAHLHAEGLAASYVARLTRTLRGAWDAAMTHGAAAANVWRGVKTGRIKARDVPWIEPGQLVRLYRAVNADQRPLVTLLGETGLRVGEALALRWSDVDLAGQVLHVREGKTKASRRSVPFAETAAAVLRRLHRDKGGDELVFRPRTTQGIRAAVLAACKRAKLPPLSTHGLRHVFCSHRVQAGIDPVTVARLVGHADGGVLVMKLYGRWMPQDAAREAQRKAARWQASRVRRAKRGKPRD